MGFQFFKTPRSVLSRIFEALIPHKLFARLDIASKMLLGYMILVVLTVAVVAYALISLQRLNTIHTSIVAVDVPAQEAAEKMIETIIAQDAYERRYLILMSADMRKLFWKRGDEFRNYLDQLAKIPDQSGLPIETLSTLHKQYSELFKQETALIQKRKKDAALKMSNEQLRKKSEQIIEALRKTAAHARQSRDGKMRLITVVGKDAFVTTALLCLVSILAGAAASLAITHHISSSIHKLGTATEHIARGDFEHNPEIRTNDEIGSLAEAFVAMGKRLKKLEEMYLDASPLTRLPGGIAIENVVNKRIESNQPLAFCVFDLDNFKAFNDRFGYASGSEVIKETARIIEASVKTNGGPDDFVGHVGGDDFVVVTTPDRMRPICDDIIKEFDQRIPPYYDPEDREKGYILGKTRQGVEMKFPIMTISISIVTNENRTLTGALQASEIAAELKDYAKTIPKSVYVVDKRRAS